MNEPTQDPDDPDSDGPLRGDLMADLFFGLGAIFLLAVVLIAPTLGLALDRSRDDAGAIADRLAATRLTAGGTPVATLFAGPDGVRPDGREPRIGLDALTGSARLAETLETARRAGDLLVVVEVGGEEAAFTLEPILAARGPATVRQIRLDRRCEFARSPAAAALCGGGP